MSITTALDARLTVNELLRRHPSVLPVLNGFGVDSCCGGAESLAQAAQSAQVPFDALMAALEAPLQRASR
jgi:iron-sulfur cluster repair protein YtfE (RIC family)